MDAKSKRYLQILLAVAVGWFLSYLFHVSTLSFVDIRKYNLFAAPNNNGAPPQPLMKEDGEFMEMMEQRMRERINTMNSACNSKRKEICKLPEMTFPGSLYNRNFNYTICRIQKVASSNWIRAVTVMDNIFSIEDLHNHRIKGDDVITLTDQVRGVRRITDIKERIRISREFLNIVMVRHPFLRVLSAFHDKMSAKQRSPGYRRMADQIERRYRVMRSDPDQRYTNITGRPTFEDFVNFLIERPADIGYRDSHWDTFQSKCAPCRYKYDVIIKVETLEEDMRFLRSKLGVRYPYSQVFLGEGRNKTHHEVQLYREIPLHLVEQLHDRYRADFEIFGYSWPSWLNKED